MTAKKIDFDLMRDHLAIMRGNGLSDEAFLQADKAIEKAEFEYKQQAKKKEYELYEHGNDGVLWDNMLEVSCRDFFRDYPDKYPADMFPEFIRYWSEPNGKGQPRWWSTKNQKNGRWHLPGRLATWFRNYKPTKGVQASNPTVPTHLRMRKLT